jgi:hypothetical protein
MQNESIPDQVKPQETVPGKAVPAQESPHDRGWPAVLSRPALRVTAMVLLLTVGPLFTASSPLTSLLNGDIFWHLRSGLWIFQNHAVPREGLFSQYVDRSWVDCNWGFDVLAAVVYKLLGIRGFVVLLMAFRLAMAGATFLVAGGRKRRFWSAVVLSAVAQYVITDLALRPILFSILSFGILLYLLIESRRLSDIRPLFWVPLLFVIWANLDAQFLDGLLLLAVYVTAEVTEAVFRKRIVPTLSVVKILGIAGLSVIATLLTPYTLRLFSGAFENAYSNVLFANFQEMQAMPFRRPQDFALMILVMAAFLALGRQRSRDLFKIGALSLFIMLAFRLQRDVWCVVLPSIAVIGDACGEWCWKQRQQVPSEVWGREKPLVAVIVLVLFGAAIVHLPTDPALMKQAGRAFPTKACDYIRVNQLPGPLFNTYYWGGFLTWYLPEYPVSMDSRLNLYGDDITNRYFKVSGGNQRLETDPSFARAQIILLERSSSMLKALTTLPALKDQFRVAYEDDVAAVLVRQ